MNIIHGGWQPESNADFIQNGQFYLWIESDEAVKAKKKATFHPQHLHNEALLIFLRETLGITAANTDSVRLQSIYLPSFQGVPLPSPELGLDLPNDGPVELAEFQVSCYRLQQPVKDINHIHFLCCYQAANTRIGSDFLFWYYFSQSLKDIFYKDRFIPALIAHNNRGKTELYRSWKIISPHYEALIQHALQQIPLACHLGYEPESLLRHFSEVCISGILEKALHDLPQVFLSKIKDEVITDILSVRNAFKPVFNLPAKLPPALQHYVQWQQRLSGNDQELLSQLGLQLHEAPAEQPDSWLLEFFLSSTQDPSLKWALSEFWQYPQDDHPLLFNQLGSHIEQQVLTQLAHAAKIYPKLWAGLETQTPESVTLTLDEAFEFLQEQAWVLEDAGVKIIVPAWLTPKGRQRAKLRLQTGSKSKTGSASAKSYLSLDNMIEFSYEFAIGDQSVSVEEWQQLVASKVPLVQFRGQWVQLDREKMQEMLALWHQQQNEQQRLSIQELLKKLAEQDEFEVNVEDSLANMLEKLNDNSQFEPIEDPELLNAKLRDYQKRGVAWMRYLESLGLNGCLADDMGLGKTMQVIASLVLERAGDKIAPTLLVAPTSVLGNWQKEVEKFAPHLKTFIHHGGGREKERQAFQKGSQEVDLVITSYTLVRKDAALINACTWQRIVLDEAQNIKNPKAAQTKAILTLDAPHRLALTGTPVENRLMDLWSIFNFLNPGYLGKQAQFRKVYELPVQRDNDVKQSAILKKLIQPFMLRRLKTDKNIIKDLPDKIEGKQYCNLSKEQASLYEAVIKDVDRQLDQSEGIARQGLMLSTLMKLKQICNHPMQFLQDGSAFTADRSNKLERLGDMLEEALAEGDSVLVFTQFTEIGECLERYLRREKQVRTYYLHGGTARQKREQMINQFQDPDMPPSVFVLSLKAGGVGITLTRANHVFHFDRWWNPAVENQATDRAFRIGQQKNVFVHKFVTLGTLEERIDQMIEDKQKMADTIIGNDESWLTQLDNDAFRALIALNKNSVMAD
ncbi:DEAD/DEAH box helicase [Methylicorpusculum oleiharenae]|uniref:DEAD/DEAH box helicase n=1 Tax=Methylicorpusculum oleiharenae TaxID=1338687 RepID=UPI00135C7D9A|nr:DEAD/DEAH box helicase [Methylicorpusculum oleiharenae]MCD2449628.1 DEAD/DEAH box helicase [Methylicorpusculum oleiharenae]